MRNNINNDKQVTSPGDGHGEIFTGMNQMVEPRPEVSTLSNGIHGSPDYAELESLGLNPEEILDFSVNSNPYGPSPRVVQAMVQAPIHRYPDRDMLLLRRSLADHLRVSMDEVGVGNGTPELLWMIALAYLRHNDTVLIIGPTFGEYARVSAMMGAGIDTWTAVEEQGFALDVPAIAAKLARRSYRAVFICNPNNPTGQVLPVEILGIWAKQNPQTLFILDEAYFSFSMAANSAIYLHNPNLIVLRSMTKDYGLAGLRLGYAIGDRQVIETLAKVRPPYSVSSLAQLAGIASLEDQSHQWNSRVRLRSDKKILAGGLKRFGCLPSPAHVHFFLLPVGNGKEFRSALLQKKLLVRDCASFGLPKYVRIATRKTEENHKLVKAVEEVLGGD